MQVTVVKNLDRTRVLKLKNILQKTFLLYCLFLLDQKEKLSTNYCAYFELWGELMGLKLAKLNFVRCRFWRAFEFEKTTKSFYRKIEGFLENSADAISIFSKFDPRNVKVSEGNDEF